MHKLKEGFIVREIGNRIMAVPVGTQTNEIHGMIALSESGKLLWQALEKGASTESLTTIITENYDVDSSVAYADVLRFIEQLKDHGALQ